MGSGMNVAQLTARNIRYRPCIILRDCQIPYTIWLEDALYCYKVKTVVFQLYLLVEDLDQATEAMLRAGWTVNAAPARIGHAEVDTLQSRLLPPEPVEPNKTTNHQIQPGQFPPFPPEGPPETVLLLAKDWYFELSTGTTIPPGAHICIPLLPKLYDSLLEVWFEDATESSTFMWSHLSVMIEYLFRYNTQMKSLDLTKELKYEHRQYHIDALSGNFERATLPWYRHQRVIRNALRAGRWQLNINSSISADLEALKEEH